MATMCRIPPRRKVSHKVAQGESRTSGALIVISRLLDARPPHSRPQADVRAFIAEPGCAAGTPTTVAEASA
jgi:hypothetical protein